MRTLAISIATLLVACGGGSSTDDGPDVTLRDLVVELAEASEARAIRCGFAEADLIAERCESSLCHNFDCDAEPPPGSDIESCVEALATHDCAIREYPVPCLDETLRWHWATGGHK